MTKARAAVVRVLSASARFAAAVLVSALFWYVALAISGVLTFACGVGLQFGRGYGLMAFGALALVGSEAIRNGLRRA